MSKGQIFSTDFLFAMIIITLCLGVIASTYEFNLYNQKQHNSQKELKEKTETAIIILTNSISNCEIKDLNGHDISLAYSINLDKLEELASEPELLKKSLAIQDTNIQIQLSKTGKILEEEINSKNIIALDLSVMTCRDSTTIIDLNECMNFGECNSIETQTLNIKVGK
jgi:Na+-transporting NADH:ubiquinone oxidoreductase subunit NqrC